MTVVIDANLMVVLALDRERAPAVERHLRQWQAEKEEPHAPALLQYEVANAFPRAVAAEQLPPEHVEEAWRLAAAVPVVLHELENGPAIIELAGQLERRTAYAERMRRQGYVSFSRARIEELPFDDASFDAVISNGAVNLSADKRRVFAEAARVLRPGGRLALADIVTEREISARTSCQADLWAACIAGASQRDLYLEDIAAAGLELQLVQDNPGYHFTSERARHTSHKYGAHSVSLLALKPVSAPRHISDPNLGSGAEVVQAAREESPINTTTTEEVPK